MPRKYVVANWKMHGTVPMVMDWARDFQAYFAEANLQNTEVVLCPPYPYINLLRTQMPDSVSLGAQDVSNQKETGAYTGEVSAHILKDCGVEYVILGHSERRALYQEGGALLTEKWLRVCEQKQVPIFCIGETWEDYQNQSTQEVLRQQLIDSVPDSLKEESSASSLLIAYEPVWAIGRGVTPSVEEIESVLSFLRKEWKSLGFFGTVSLLYGGSVNAKNASVLLSSAEIDGVLVGGASLSPLDFFKICQAGG